jgi:predicted DNA-binding transcriptional regulator YafY
MTPAIAPNVSQEYMRKMIDLLGKCTDGLTAMQIAKRLSDRTERQVHRYLATLKQSLIVIDSQDGIDRAKVWKLLPPDEREQSQRALNSENFAMVAAEAMIGWLPPAAATQVTNLARDARDMLDKLAASDAEDKERRIQAAWPTRFKSFPGAFLLQTPVVDHRCVDDIKDAVYQQRQLDVSYLTRSGRRSDIRNFHPLAYLHVGHTGYVVGYDGGDAASSPKLYAVQRFHRAHVLDQRFPVTVPRNFNLDNFLETSEHARFISGPQRRVRLKIWDWLIPVLRESKLSDDMRMDPPDAEIDETDGAIVTATVATSWQFSHWILSCGEAIEVLEPVDLRQEIMTRVSAAAARYSASILSDQDPTEPVCEA